MAGPCYQSIRSFSYQNALDRSGGVGSVSSKEARPCRTRGPPTFVVSFPRLLSPRALSSNHLPTEGRCGTSKNEVRGEDILKTGRRSLALEHGSVVCVFWLQMLYKVRIQDPSTKGERGELEQRPTQCILCALHSPTYNTIELKPSRDRKHNDKNRGYQDLR